MQSQTEYNTQEQVTRVSSLADVFNALCLPVPEKQDLAEIQMGHLVPLQDYGAVLRIERYIESEGYGEICTAPCALQPIHSFEYREEGKTYRARLVPGIARVGITEKDYAVLDEAFSLHNYVLLKDPEEKSTGHKDDCGYLTCRIGDKIRVLPILFDITDTRGIPPPFDYRIQLESGMFTQGQNLCGVLAQMQDILYGDLREKCAEMVGSCADSGNGAALEFWSEMRRLTTDHTHGGIPPLRAAWTRAATNADSNCKAEIKRSSIVDASQNYARTLRKHDLHASVLPG